MARREKPMHHDLKILVLGDEDNPVDLIERELSKLSLRFTAEHVASLDAFLHALQESSPDLILVTSRGDGFGGLTALALAQEVSPKTPFFFINDMAPQTEATGNRARPVPEPKPWQSWPRARLARACRQPLASHGRLTRRTGTC